MKKVIVCFVVLLTLIALTAVWAEEEGQKTNDYSTYTVDELLKMRDDIEQELIRKGYSFFYEIDRNDRGESVERLQKKLTELGYYSGRITGKMDNETIKAEKKFEKINGLKNDGIASIEDQQTLYSGQALENPNKPQKEIKQETPVDPNIEKYKDYANIDYEDCFRYPEKHLLQKVTMKGKVVQVLGSRKEGFQIRLELLGSGGDIVFVFINNDPGYNILENDKLTVYGYMYDTVTYTSTMNASITIPAAIAEYIVLM